MVVAELTDDCKGAGWSNRQVEPSQDWRHLTAGAALPGVQTRLSVGACGELIVYTVTGAA